MNRLLLGLGGLVVCLVGVVLGYQLTPRVKMGAVYYDKTYLQELDAAKNVAVGKPSVGKLCLWNGTQYSVLYFPAGSTTPTVATSTACN